MCFPYLIFISCGTGIIQYNYRGVEFSIFVKHPYKLRKKGRNFSSVNIAEHFADAVEKHRSVRKMYSSLGGFTLHCTRLEAQQ